MGRTDGALRTPQRGEYRWPVAGWEWRCLVESMRSIYLKSVLSIKKDERHKLKKSTKGHQEFFNECIQLGNAKYCVARREKRTIPKAERNSVMSNLFTVFPCSEDWRKD